MHKSTLKIFSISIIFLIVSIVGYSWYASITPHKTIVEYYKILDNKETVLSGEKIDEKLVISLRSCRDDLKCVADIYKKYNDSTTLERTFSNIALLLKNYPEFADRCYFMMQGVGHSELRKNNNDVLQTLKFFSEKQPVKNMSSCGNGYIHGVLKEGARSITDKDKLVVFFNTICNSEEMKKIGEVDCYHGLGFAAAIQLNYDITGAVYVCKRVARTIFDTFNCYTGIFMEAATSLSTSEIIKQGQFGFEFPICDKLTDELEMQACFFGAVIGFKKYAPKDESGKVRFADMTPMCKVFNADFYRLLCIRNISIRSISENRETDLKKMCVDNTGSRAERVYCVTGFAHRLALSLDSKRGVEYIQTYTDICKVLSAPEAALCIDIIKNRPGKVYQLFPNDLKM